MMKVIERCNFYYLSRLNLTYLCILKRNKRFPYSKVIPGETLLPGYFKVFTPDEIPSDPSQKEKYIDGIGACFSPFDLIITSSDNIKKGDTIYHVIKKECEVVKKLTFKKIITVSGRMWTRRSCRKIIASTSPGMKFIGIPFISLTDMDYIVNYTNNRYPVFNEHEGNTVHTLYLKDKNTGIKKPYICPHTMYIKIQKNEFSGFSELDNWINFNL